MNEFGVGKICDTHYVELVEEFGDVEQYTIMLTFNDRLVCSNLACNEVPVHLVTIPKGARERYGKKEAQPIRQG